MNNPKILIDHLMITFTLGCCLVAIYMAINQISRFIENRDASTITYKRFNRSPDDKYPTFSLCFQGSDISWYQDELIFNEFGITSAQYGKLLKGENVFKYEYDFTTRLYRKIPIDIRNISISGFEMFHLTPADILSEVEFATQNLDDSITYDTAKNKKKPMVDIPFYFGYISPEMICFTRNTTDFLGSLRSYDWLAFKGDILGKKIYQNVIFKIYIHYPGHLIRSFHKPNFESSIRSITRGSAADSTMWEKILKLTLSQVLVLRRRQDSNEPCDPENNDDDSKVKLEIIKLSGCVPTFWKKNLIDERIIEKFDDCESPRQLHEIADHIKNYKNVLLSYKLPCVEMTVLSLLDKEVENKLDKPCMKILYTEEFYQEIENVRSFNFESFLAGVGGFVGMFLGYSVLQLPEMAKNLPKLLRRFINHT